MEIHNLISLILLEYNKSRHSKHRMIYLRLNMREGHSLAAFADMMHSILFVA